MGKISFSVYLIHLPIIATIGVYFFNQLFGIFGYSSSALIASFINIILIYLLSIIYYKWVDKPSVNIARKIPSLVIKG
jgi:peptidoglycan/LPS O-acetylase OafA/YrhL